MPDAQKHKRSIPAPPAAPKPASDAGAGVPAPPATPGTSAPTEPPAHP
jgi:hypothetical protein